MTDEAVDRGDEIVEETEASEEEATEETGAEASADESSDESTESTESDKQDVDDSEPMLPKHRYDTVRARNRALQERLERMEQERQELLERAKGSETTPSDKPADTDEESPQELLIQLEEKITDALLDGDKSLVVELRKKQRELEQYIFQQELASTAQNATFQAREQVRLDTTVDFLEATYPELNPDAENFNQELVNELEELRAAFEASGQYSPSQALLKAAKYMFPDVPETPTAPAAPSKSGAVKKAVSAAQKQPPSLKKVGQDADTGGIVEDIDPSKITEKDLEALPEQTLARLRGDIV